MSLVKKKKQQGVLFLVVLADSLKCALHLARGAATRWPVDWQLDIPFEYEASHFKKISPISEALAKLQVGVSDLTPSFSVSEIRVLVAENWVQSVQVPWSDALLHSRSTQENIRMHFEAKGCRQPDLGNLKLDDAPFGQVRLAVAYSTLMLDDLKSFSEKLGAKLSSILPISIAVWQLVQERKNMRVVWVIGERQLLILRGSGKPYITEVISHQINNLNVETLSIYWQRLRLRTAELATEGTLHVLDLSTSPLLDVDVSFIKKVEVPCIKDSALPSVIRLAYLSKAIYHPLDAISSQGITRSRLLLLVAALALTGGGVAHVWQTGEKLQQLKLTQSSQTKEITNTNTALTRNELRRIPAVNTAIRELNLPITVLLAAMVPPKDIQVSILNIEATAQSSSNEAIPTIKIVGTAKTGADMALYVAFLSERKPFIGAHLIRHEVVASQIGQPFRFIMEAKWQR